LQKYVPLSKPLPSTVKKNSCKELGEWYMDKAKLASPAGKPVALNRARMYYRAFVEKHGKDDVEGIKAKKTLKQLNQLTGHEDDDEDETASGQWVNLMTLISARQHALVGRWIKAPQGIAVVSETDDSRLMIPVCPMGSYELDITFRATSGDDGMTVILTAGGEQVLLWVGRYDWRYIHLLDVKNMYYDYTCNLTTRFDKNESHRLQVKVKQDGAKVYIRAVVDEKYPITWRGEAKDLDLPDDWRMPSKQILGIGSSECKVAFTSLKIRMLSGKLQQLRVKR